MKITEKYIVNLILSIVLVFSLTGSMATVFAKEYLLDADTFIEVSDKHAVPEMAYNEINEYFIQSEAYSRIPADVYMSAMTVEDIKFLIDNKIKSRINYIYNVTTGDYKEYGITDSKEIAVFTRIEQNITDYFNEFAKENNVEVDDKYNTQLKNTIDTAISEIEDFTDVYMLNLVEKTGVFEKLRSVYGYLDIAMYGCMGLAGICLILIIVFSIKRISNAFYWISISTICSAIIGLVPMLYLKLSGITDRFIVRNECVYTAYTSFMSDAINTILIAELLVIAVGAVLLCAGIVISKFSKKTD